MRALELRSTPFEEASYHARVSGDPDCEQIVNDICVIRADWRSILPTANNSEVNVMRATMVLCIMTGGTILRLCKKVKVVFKDIDPKWLTVGKPITPQRMSYVTATQSKRRPQRRKRVEQ
ncbi:hypothetical protein AHAS_Ahas06G0158900 [Arachis hypogaea]